MKYKSSLSGHIHKVKGLKPGIKDALMDCDYHKLPTTIENVKKAYLTRFGKELKGDHWRQWLAIPTRGHTWVFLNEIRYHGSCNYIEFKFGADEKPHQGRSFLKHAFF